MREAEFEEWFKDKELETCDGVPMLWKDFIGVTRNGNKWRAQIKSSKLKSLGHLGYYGSPKEAALAVKRKRAELLEMFKGNDDSLITESVGKSASISCMLDHTPKLFCKDKELETCDGVPMLLNDFIGVSRKGDKWRARIKHPKLKGKVHIGYYGSPKEAALAVKRRKAEYEEMFKADDDVDCLSMGSVEKTASVFRRLDYTPKKICKDKVGGEMHFLGVTKRENKWQARVRHPKLKIDIDCGRYSTPEEAAFVVEERKAELEEMLKSDESSSVEPLRDQFGRKKLPYGVSWKDGRYYVRVWRPVLKKYVLLDSYSSLQEATSVAKIKMEEFKGDEVLQDAECKVASKSESLDVLTGDFSKVPPGVTRNKSGRWVARTRDAVSRSQIWLGTYNTAEEAISTLNKKKAEFAARMNKAMFDVSEVNEGPVNIERELGIDSPTSSVAAHDFNTAGLRDKLNYRVVDIPTSFFEPESSNIASVGDQTCDFDFDKAVSLGFINEYGQLMGRFSELDEYMSLDIPDENVAATTPFYSS